MLLLVIIIFIGCWTTTISNAQYTIAPVTQYVFVGQTATFECATDNGTVSISVSGVAGVAIPDPVDLPGGGQLVTASFTVTAANNGSAEVICLAQPQGSIVFIPSAMVTAYAQVISSPSSIEATQIDPCSISVQWEEPFLLPGLSVSYTVSVYSVDTVSVHSVSTTTFTYHPTTGSGVYTVQVRAFNGALTSEAINTTMEFHSDGGKYVRYNNFLSQRRDTTWIYQYDLVNLCSISISNVTVTSCSRNTLICYTASTAYNNVTIIGEDIIITAMTLPDNNIFNTTVSLEYESGQLFLSTEIETSTHNLQNLSIVNITSNTLCLQFTLVYGTTTHDVHIQLSSNTDAYHIHYSYKHVHASECFNGVPSNNWTLIACDSGNSNTCISNPAIILYNVHVPGTINITTTSTVQPSDIATPQVTVLHLTEQHSNVELIILAVFLSICFSILLAINIIMLIIHCYKKIHKQPSSSSSSIEVHTIPPTSADYDNFHPSTTTLQIQDCSAYGVVNVACRKS